MLFVWLGFLKRNAEPIPPSVEVQATDFLGQPLMKVRSGGPLLDATGKRAAMMLIFGEESRAAAKTYVGGSPYLKADLYEHYALYEFR